MLAPSVHIFSDDGDELQPSSHVSFTGEEKFMSVSSMKGSTSLLFSLIAAACCYGVAAQMKGELLEMSPTNL